MESAQISVIECGTLVLVGEKQRCWSPGPSQFYLPRPDKTERNRCVGINEPDNIRDIWFLFACGW